MPPKVATPRTNAEFKQMEKERNAAVKAAAAAKTTADAAAAAAAKKASDNAAASKAREKTIADKLVAAENALRLRGQAPVLRHGTGQVAPFAFPGSNTCPFPVMTSSEANNAPSEPPRRRCNVAIADGEFSCEACNEKDKSDLNGSLAAFNAVAPLQFCSQVILYGTGVNAGKPKGLPCTAGHRCVLFGESDVTKWPSAEDMYRCPGDFSLWCSTDCLTVDGADWKPTPFRRIVICHHCARNGRGPEWCEMTPAPAVSASVGGGSAPVSGATTANTPLNMNIQMTPALDKGPYKMNNAFDIILNQATSTDHGAIERASKFFGKKTVFLPYDQTFVINKSYAIPLYTASAEPAYPTNALHLCSFLEVQRVRHEAWSIDHTLKLSVRADHSRAVLLLDFLQSHYHTAVSKHGLRAGWLYLLIAYSHISEADDLDDYLSSDPALSVVLVAKFLADTKDAGLDINTGKPAVPTTSTPAASPKVKKPAANGPYTCEHCHGPHMSKNCYRKATGAAGRRSSSAGADGDRRSRSDRRDGGGRDRDRGSDSSRDDPRVRFPTKIKDERDRSPRPSARSRSRSRSPPPRRGGR